MASKITPQDMKDQQFVIEQFTGVTDFTAFLQGVIDLQETLLSAKIGVTLFNSSAAEILGQVKQAAINLTASDLTQRRMVVASANINEDTARIIDALSKIKKSYDDTAAQSISRILGAGASTDSGGYFGSVVVSSGNDANLERLWPSEST